MKRCSTSSIIRGMQTKTTKRYHIIPVRMTVIKKSTNSKCWRGCRGTGIFLHWECKLVKPLWRTVWSYLEKVKIELPYDPTNPSLGIYLEKKKDIIQKDTCTPMFISALFIIVKTWKQLK